jgi:transposase
MGGAQHETLCRDVSVKETSLCIVDEAGRICREMKVVSHPEDLLAVLCDPAWRLERVGLEAGPLSQWLFSGLAEAGSGVRLLERNVPSSA